MPESSQVAVAGIFASDSSANRARHSLGELGMPTSMIALVSSDDQAAFERQPALLTRFSEPQKEHFRNELAQGNVLLLVEAPEPVDRVVTRLSISGALHIDIGEFVQAAQSHHTMPIREEQITVDKATRVAGEAVIRKSVEEIPVDAEVNTTHEELDIERVSVDEVVEARHAPWREGDVLVVPVYEERLRVVREWVMREQLRIRLHQVQKTHTIADSVRREHVEVDDPGRTGRVNVHDYVADSDTNNPSPPSE